MRKILGLILLVISCFGLFSFSDEPPKGWKVIKVGNVEYYTPPSNYQYRVVRERSIAAMFDSGLHIPSYNGTPSGSRTGVWPWDGAIAMDTTNHRFYIFSGNAWVRQASYTDIADASNFANTDLTLAADRTHNANYFDVELNNIKSWATIAGTSPIYTTFEHDSTYIKVYGRKDGNISQMLIRGDSILFQPANGVLNIDSLQTTSDTTDYKPIAWNPVTGSFRKFDYWSGGGGSVNTGAANKAAYYPSGGTTVDDWAGVEFGNTNLNTKITAGATTEVPLEIKLASSQTANAFNVSSSAGTGDLVSIDKDGTIRTAKSFIAIGDLSLRAGTPAGVYAGIDLTTTTYPGIWFGTNSSSANVNDFAFLFNESSGQTAFNTPNSSGSINFRIDNEYNNSLLYHSNLNLGVGFAYNGTPTGRVHIAAGTATAGTAPLKFTAGTNLTTPEIGAMEFVDNGTTGHLYITANVGGVDTRLQLDQQKPSLNKGVFIQAPTSADVVDVWQTPVAITITSLKAILRGTTPSVTYNIRFGTDITSATDVFTSDITCTSVTTGCSNSSGFNDATIPAGSFIWIVTTAASGTINSIGLTINYTED